jgi:uncharacterized membrane protein
MRQVFGPASLMAGDQSWIIPAVCTAVAGLALILWLNRSRLRHGLGNATGPLCRGIAWLLLTACLVNPLWSSLRPRSGANVLAVAVDTSRSLDVRPTSAPGTRADEFATLLRTGESTEPLGWLKRLEQDFQLRRYTISDRLQQTNSFEQLNFNGPASSLQTALRSLQQRYAGQPLAGILLLTDGNATDLPLDLSQFDQLPPVYPVLPSAELQLPDISTGSVTITQSAFDDAPVTVQVAPQITGTSAGQIRVILLAEDGTPLESQSRSVSDPAPLRFKHRPTGSGTVFYRLQTALVDDDGTEITTEATPVNNSQLIAVNRPATARRILYVSGRPNWDFKFLRRAVESDPQLQITGLIRIARREARFDFRGREGETSNSLFRGFDRADPDTVEEYDEPVLVRLNTQSPEELRSGFPEKPEDLFLFDAIVLDDLEADFFQADQMQLLYDFVSRRGGGFLMLSGQESFAQGGFDRTPVGELLPIDVSRTAQFPNTGVRLELTRDGWLQPWVRLRGDEPAEQQRLQQMPEFLTLNPPGYVRPGAQVMAEVRDAEGTVWPALIVQRFGRGRSAAVCVGDLWRWRLNEGRRQFEATIRGQTTLPSTPTPASTTNTATPAEDLSDHARACRQLMRWLVSDVPKRLDVLVKDIPEQQAGAVKITALVRGPDFEPRENADVKFKVTAPDGREFELTAVPSDSETGLFQAELSAAQEGAWKVATTATLADGPSPETLSTASGWASQPALQELRSVSLQPQWLEELAKKTGGKVLRVNEIESLVQQLPNAAAPLQEVRSWPIWHSWWVFLTAIALLCTDWTLRRRRGLP